MRVGFLLSRRPVAACILLLAICLLGIRSMVGLPVAPLPQVDFPVIQVSAQMPGGSARTMANAVAVPLEKQLALISGIKEIYSVNSLKSTVITVMFSLDRNIDGAARDVAAAIQAAKRDLPSTLDGLPTYRKLNPAEIPVAIYALTSPVAPRTTLYRVAEDTLQPLLSRINGVGNVTIAGGAAPAIRVDVDVSALARHDLTIDAVGNALQNANVSLPLGSVPQGDAMYPLEIDDSPTRPTDYGALPIAANHSGTVLLSDIATVTDGVQDIRNYAIADGKPAVLLLVYKKPASNIVSTVSEVRRTMQEFEAHGVMDVRVTMVLDRAATIEASIAHVKTTLLVASILVMAVIMLFLRDWRRACISGLSIPVSVFGTFFVMQLLGYSINNLSLLALVIATGIIVDDAIVVVENITRWAERNEGRHDHIERAVDEVRFSVLAMTVSLVAVFSPIIFLQGFVGQLLREFSVTLAVAVLISMFFSLFFVPVLVGSFATGSTGVIPRRPQRAGRLTQVYRRTLTFLIRRWWIALVVMAGLTGSTVAIAVLAPKSVFPIEDTGGILGTMEGGQYVSFGAMRQQLQNVSEAIGRQPGARHVVGFVGGNNPSNTGTIFVMLQPRELRSQSVTQFISRALATLAENRQVRISLGAVQDLLVSAKQQTTQIQMEVEASQLDDARKYGRLALAALERDPLLSSVDSDLKTSSSMLRVDVSRSMASLYGLSMRDIDTAIYDSFGQRAFSTVYGDRTPRRIVLEFGPEQFISANAALDSIRVGNTNGGQVELRSVSSWAASQGELTVNHDSRRPSVTLSFDPASGVALSQALASSRADMQALKFPTDVHIGFRGNAALFESTVRSVPYLLVGALLAVYICLGVLYESFVHPLTILSTLPPAMAGAFVVTRLAGLELSVDTVIALLLLVGIVKKNAILMVDFALSVRRQRGVSAQEAIIEGATARARPVLMTTIAAVMGAVPLVVSGGYGEELRRPLGIAIIGGLAASQAVTLFTTPVLFVLFDRLSATVVGCSLWGRGLLIMQHEKEE